MVLYRKYRPQTLDEIIGQESAKQALKSAISSGRLSHAYLFCGPRGTGKTSTARILAKIVNCELANSKKAVVGSRTTVSVPCNKCPSCISIIEGSNLDVIEMDAASNRGIDDIRALRENIKLAPTSARKKVYIIDEVHMLSGEAFNALLKTLEEPPEHVLFILATTEDQKIPQTILSRTLRLDFKQATTEELVENINRVASAEKLTIETAAVLFLAKKAQGSFRDAVKFLDMLSGFEKIDQKMVEEYLGVGVFEKTCELLGDIAQCNPSHALKIVIEEIEAGVNIKEMTLSILDILRQLLLIKYDLGSSLVRLEVGGDRFAILENLASKFDLNHLIKTINFFQESLEQGRFASISTLPLELAVVESCGTNGFSGKNKSEVLETIKESSQPKTVSPSSDFSENPDIQKIQDRWTYILETVKAYNFSLEALLRSTKILKCDEETVVFEVPYSFHQRILEASKSKDILESILSDVLSKSIKISTILGQRPVQREELANIEVAADDEIIKIAAEIFNSEPN